MEPVDDALKKACQALKSAKNGGGRLLVLTGAGMSVSSGVPVFRNRDGSMSVEFTNFLQQFNAARRAYSMSEADDWFSFSTPSMFRRETEQAAWKYWRWRILRAQVEPGSDYKALDRIVEYFGKEKVFVITSNCDGLHANSLVGSSSNLKEIHGSLSVLQCSGACGKDLFPLDEAFLQRLRDEQDWVPYCPKCKTRCLRPNVVIFNDDSVVYGRLQEQDEHLNAFFFEAEPRVILEIGAGVVVPSIRHMAEHYATESVTATTTRLIRINPSREECQSLQNPGNTKIRDRLIPVPLTSVDALGYLANELFKE